MLLAQSLKDHFYFTPQRDHLSFKTTLRGGLFREVPLYAACNDMEIKLDPLLYIDNQMMFYTRLSAITMQWYIFQHPRYESQQDACWYPAAHMAPGGFLKIKMSSHQYRIYIIKVRLP